MVRVLTDGQMAASSQVDGRRTRCMDKANSLGMTVAFMKENTLMIRSMEKESLVGQMAESTMVSGPMVDSMVLESTLQQTGALAKENGSMEREYNGLMLPVKHLDIQLLRMRVLQSQGNVD